MSRLCTSADDAPTRPSIQRFSPDEGAENFCYHRRPLMPSTLPEIRLVELAYEVGRGTREWVGEVGKLVQELVPGEASYVLEYTHKEGLFCVRESWSDDRELLDGVLAMCDMMSAELLDPFLPKPVNAGTARELLGGDGIAFDATPLAPVCRRLGIKDLFAVAASGLSGSGVVFGTALAAQAGPSREARARLVQVGAHVAAGVRLRRKLTGIEPEDAAEAVLRADGTIEHLDGPGPADHEILSEAVKRVELARRHSREPDEALHLWQGLVSGRWSLVDRFESDGRSYYVAIANRPEVAKLHSLSRREAEVVAYIASGTDTKSTAYALGLKAVTVRSHLRTAMTKLGVDSRPELIRLRAALFDLKG